MTLTNVRKIFTALCKYIEITTHISKVRLGTLTFSFNVKL